MIKLYATRYALYVTRSFTLIELIIVTTIILLFAGMSLGYYNTFTEEKGLNSDVAKIQNALELAKKKANAGDVSQCANPGSTAGISGYMFSIVDSTTFQVSPLCLSGTSNAISYKTERNNIISITGAQPVMFYSLTNKATERCIVITNSSLNKSEYVKVQSSGVTEIGKGATCL